MLSERLTRSLHAYHDGELRGIARWWLERRIARDPAAQAELARLAQLGEALRVQAEEAPSPDLWSAIVLQLPPATPAAEPARESEGWLGGFTLPKWAGALVAAGAIALAVVVTLRGGPEIAPPGVPVFRGSSVQLLDTGRRPAFILQDDSEATIIWLLQKQKTGAGRNQDVLG